MRNSTQSSSPKSQEVPFGRTNGTRPPAQIPAEPGYTCPSPPSPPPDPHQDPARRTASSAAISDLAAVIGAVGGGVVTGLFAPATNLFGWYAIGLLLGMILYPLIFFRLAGRERTTQILGPDADPRPR